MGEDQAMPAGFEQLVQVLSEVYKRRSLSKRRPRSLRHKRDEAPPIFAVVQKPLEPGSAVPGGQPAPPAVLTQLSGRLQPRKGASPELRVPHCVVGLEDKSPDSGPDAELQPVEEPELDELIELLDRAVVGLRDRRGGRYDFPRYDLIRWLIRTSFETGSSRPHVQARRAMYRRVVGGVGGTGAWARIQERLPLWLVVISFSLIPGFFRLRHSGRVPGLGSAYRWLRSQRYVPRGEDNLFELAVRISADHWSGVDAERRAALLVAGFLADLQAGFRPVEWFGQYRATHPILMVGPISRTNGGYLLVRMVAVVRNDSEKDDPLLLITAGRKVPPLAREPRGATPAGDLQAWRQRLQKSLRPPVDAWLMSFPIGAGDPQLDDRVPLRRMDGPWWRKRSGGAMILGTSVALIASCYTGYGILHDRRHCVGDGFTWFPVERQNRTVARVDGDCVGITDGTNSLLFPSESFAPVGATILEQNKRAEELSREQPERPVATLVFMISTEGRPLESGVFTALREQLAGLAVAQAVQLTKPSQRYEPILKVKVANAGRAFRHADRVAEQLRDLVAEDPTVVAVVGLEDSRRSTANMIRKLAAAGLPTVAATLTADTMVDVSRMYLQISPQNRREAAVASAHVQNLLRTGKDPFGRPLQRRATIYKSDDPADIYSQNLAKDLQQELSAARIPVEVLSYSASGEGTNANQAGRDACDRRGTVFFAGRGQIDFQAFLGGIQDRCRTRPPFVLGGDDTTKYTADREVSSRNRSVGFQYLALALAPGLVKNAPPESSDFYQRLEELFPYEKDDRGRSLDGHAALSFDAAYAVVLAVSYLHRDSIAVNGGSVWSALQSITDANGAQRAYQGVTGRIDYGGTIARRVPIDKPVAIVTFEGGRPVPDRTLVCGPRKDSPPWCPVERS